MTQLSNATATKIIDAISKPTDDLARRRREDFDFMVLCESKGNMAMYRLLRDRSLDDEVKVP